MSRAQQLAVHLPSAPLRWGARTLRRGSSVSVVVVVTDDNALFLPECIDALGAQSRKAQEILLVVTGAGAETARTVARQTAASWRIRTVTAAAEGLTSALLLGSSAARGDYLWCLDAGDVALPEAVECLAGALDRSGSDLVLGGPAAGEQQTLAEAPRAVETTALRQQMVRGRTLLSRSLQGVEGPVGEWLPGLRNLAGAPRFDTCPRPVVREGRRGTGAAFGSMPILAPWVGTLAEAVEEASTRLGELSPQARDHFLFWVARYEGPRWLGDAERCTPEQWQVLRTVTTDAWSRTTPEQRAATPNAVAVRHWLAAQDRREDLAVLEVESWIAEGQHPTTVRAGRVFADLPVRDLPQEVRELGAADTRLTARVRRVHRLDDDGLRLEVLAFIAGVGGQHGPVNGGLTLVTSDGRRLPLETTVVADPDVNRVAGERFQDHSQGVLLGSLDPARLTDGELREAHLEVSLTVAGVQRSAEVPAGLADLGRTPVGEPSDVRVQHLALDGALLVVRGIVPSGRDARLELRGAHDGVVSSVPVDGAFEVPLTLEEDPWSLGPVPLRSGDYRLEVRDADDGVVPLRLAAPAEPGVRRPLRSDVLRVRVEEAGGSLGLGVGPPLRDEEIGAAGRERSRRWYTDDDHRVDPGCVLLQSYTGQAATDSPLAIHEALQRLRPDLRLRWGVADRSVRLPEGAEPLVLHSREWYAALATSGSIVTNADMDWWFVKRPGQRLLQTFHGYPSKTMGLSAWHGKNFTPMRLDRLLRRTAGTWDLLLTPTPAMDVHYREQYRYEGAIHSYGYPRDDVLVDDRAATVRRLTRDRLGIGDRTAVLYAPTWRDDLATNFRAASSTGSFDVEEAAAALGDDHVILMRGHRFHRRRDRLGDRLGRRLMDVTHHPDINHLVLAADAAVLDYSSLRFDFALTGRPMVFFVPDLDRYQGRVRGFLFDFASSAPGPHLSTTGEVVDALRGLASLRADYRDDLERFNRTFNAYQDGHAADRVVRAFFDVPQPAPADRGAV